MYPFNVRDPFGAINFSDFTSVIVEDTSKILPPEIGSVWESEIESIQVLAISQLLKSETFKEIKDRVILFRVIEVHSPEDTTLTPDDQCMALLYSELLSMYTPKA